MRCWGSVLSPQSDPAATQNWPDWQYSSQCLPACQPHSPQLFPRLHLQETVRGLHCLSDGPAGPEETSGQHGGPQVTRREAFECPRRRRVLGSGSDCSREMKELLMRMRRYRSTTPGIRQREEGRGRKKVQVFHRRRQKSGAGSLDFNPDSVNAPQNNGI